MTSLDPAPRGASLPVRLRQSLLGGGVLYLLLFTGTHTFIAATATATGFGPLAAAVLLVVTVSRTLLMLRRDRRIADRTAVIICCTLLVVAYAGTWMLERRGDALDYAAWSFGAVTFVLLALTVAGRFVAAWLTMAGVASIAVGWSVAHGWGPMPGAQLVERHVATLLVGTALAVSLRRSISASEAFRALERRRRAEERAAHARAAARRSAAEAVLEQAAPSLLAIAEGRARSADDRTQLLVLEGALRDQIRTAALVRSPLQEAVGAARQRGVNVLLLDEADGVPEDIRTDAVAWLADAIGHVTSGRFTGRLRAVEEGLKVTAVTDEESSATTFPVRPVGAG